MNHLFVSLRAFAVLTLLTGVLYPLVVTTLGHFISASGRGGSLIERDGQVVGSELIGQPFTQARYFWPRPSSVKYDAASSGASNLGPASAELAKAVREREGHGAVAEMRYASGSGLDPHISSEAALSQVERVAVARGRPPEEMRAIVMSQVSGRQFGFLGQPRVNVLLLNLALDRDGR